MTAASPQQHTTAYTITTQFNNITAGCFIHPAEDRALTVREGARLQSFPDSYQFEGSTTSKCRQIGNAVPPRLAQHLAAAIATALDKEVRPRVPTMVRSIADTAPSPREPKRRERLRDATSTTQIAESLRARGLSFHTSVPLLEGHREVDILIDEPAVAVLLNSCFLHGCRQHSRRTRSTTEWWAPEIKANVQRDASTARALRKSGFEVIVIWDHEDPADAAERVLAAAQAGPLRVHQVDR